MRPHIRGGAKTVLELFFSLYSYRLNDSLSISSILIKQFGYVHPAKLYGNAILGLLEFLLYQNDITPWYQQGF